MAGYTSPFDATGRLQPVVITGSEVPAYIGTPVGEIWAYRFELESEVFIQVPVQVDECALFDLTDGASEIPVYEMTYDWAGVDDGLLDDDDEVVFMARDVGDRAPDTDVWVPGATDTRIEVRIEDPLTGGTGWVYLFSSPTITDADPQFSYVEYVVSEPEAGIGRVETATYFVGYEGRWLLTRIEILGGPDILDRVKVRGHALVGRDTEEGMERRSDLLGAYSGKVRAVREVRGADSGPLMTSLDTFYRDTWVRALHYRIHLMPRMWHYHDYLEPEVPGRFYSSTLGADGLVVDGADEDPPSTVRPTWSQVSLPDGTLVVYDRELTPFPPVAGCTDAGEFFYWRDDRDFNDTTGEERGAFGNHGMYLRCMDDTNMAPYSRSLTHYLLPPQDPFAPVGPDYAEREENPLQISVQTQLRHALTDATLVAVDKVAGGRLRFEWTDALGEDRYEIYAGELATPFAYGHDTPIACDLAAQTTSWTTDEDHQTGRPSSYYLVVPGKGSEREYGSDSAGAPRPPSSDPCPAS